MLAQVSNTYKLTYHFQPIDEDRIATAFDIVFQKVVELSAQQKIESNGKDKYGENILQNP